MSVTAQDTSLGLEHRLLLLAWLNSLFGYKENRELLHDIRGASEGYDASGHSFVFHHLTGRGAKLDAHLAQALPQYDDNIRVHLHAINAGRPAPITLRYFQYLAVLYTEVILDRWMNHRAETLKALNRFAKARAAQDTGRAACPAFTVTDLQKLAFWMATGSGKTLIMHLNFRQFLHYNGKRTLDNILLITPNEGLSDQHMTEMAASGIASRRFTLGESGLALGGRHVVQVIEITKLVEEKRGGGVTVGVECFQGNNLIFVDEGHKGAGGEVWRAYRDRLGETGFTFEYSATFGQALTAAGDDSLTQEYGKCIVFDYSYKYFHGDGYGKDFQVLNLQQTTTPAQTELLLLGGLLSFYEQHRYWRDNRAVLQPYNLDAPLWVFVGSSVNAVYKEDGKPRSDVLTVAHFLHSFLGNPYNRIVQGMEKILAEKTGITLGDDTQDDLFAGRFPYLKAIPIDARALYQTILRDIFGTPAGAALHLCDLKARAGELGLRAGNSEQCFGVIYIGDTSTFKTLVEEDGAGIVVEDDIVSPSLFNTINDPSSPIQILVGAKKFMEGWNSWRVSNMGLLNIGKREGSEIIQLFGRGVRLRGRKMSLQRSNATDGEHPPHVALLETLNIFALRANYMAQFRSYLEREGVPFEGSDVLHVKIKADATFLKSQLLIPVPEKNQAFDAQCLLALQPDPAAKIRLDLSVKVTSIKSGDEEIATTVAIGGKDTPIPSESLSCVDWQQLWLDLVQYKELKSWRNLHIPIDAPRRIIEHNPRLYTLISQDDQVNLAGFEHSDRLHRTVLAILQRYAEKFYSISRQRWESDHTVYVPLTRQHPNFQDVTVRVPKSEHDLIKHVRKLIQEADKLYKTEAGELPRLHFDRHLYQPLLIERAGRLTIQPAPLKASEQRFVAALRDLVKAEAAGLLKGKEIFLLRNLSRGCGIGFFENEGFYPDFILWIKEGQKQRVIFIEPHGMRHEKAYWDNEKVKLHQKLKDFTYRQKTGKACMKLESVDSFIITETPLEVLQAHFANWTTQQLEDSHILIAKEGQTDYLRTIFA